MEVNNNLWWSSFFKNWKIDIFWKCIFILYTRSIKWNGITLSNIFMFINQSKKNGQKSIPNVWI